MQNIRKITEDLYYIGCSERKLTLFENIYPIPRGVSYNSYIILDEKNVLLDTADSSVSQQFFENLSAALNGKKLDYLIVNHMEPDHCALIEDLILKYPEVRIVTNAKAANMISQFFTINLENRLQIVTENDSINTGKHELHFVMAPMVHWPEVMVTYDSTNKILFSADAFGTFGALNGNIYADQVNFERDWLDDARRYLTNIVGKYGLQVQTILKKAATLDIQMICPLHGPIWRENLGWFIHKYDQWSRYEAEEEGVLIVYGSIYGHTTSAAEKMASILSEKGVRNIAMYDASTTDTSYLLSEAFKYSHMVIASSTYNAGIFTPIEQFVLDLKSHNLQHRSIAIIENGTWAAQSGGRIREILAGMKNMTVLGENLSLKSSMKAEQLEDMNALASLLIADMKFDF